MGFGSYSAADWTKLKDSRKLSTTNQVTEVFQRTSCNPKFDPRYIGVRECFDSDEHPNTTPIVVGLDVTGSMGYLATQIATESLNELIMKLYSTGVVTDPALMCAAYGDYKDSAPLQVTQFESDIRIAEQLLDLYFENCGQTKVVPTCLWEFLSRHTNIDAVNKRGEKGFVFTIGDGAKIRKDLVADTVTRGVGDIDYRLTRERILAEVQEKFHVFHIMVGFNGNEDILEGHRMHIPRLAINSIPEIIISTIQMQKGMDIDTAVAQWDELKRTAVLNAVSQLRLADIGQPITL